MPEPLSPPDFEPLPDDKPEPQPEKKEAPAIIIDAQAQIIRLTAGVEIKAGTLVWIDNVELKAYPVLSGD